jgi:hypothetical protein
MRFSEDTIDLILDIKEYSGGKLRNDFELSALIEHTINKNNQKTFNDIIFKAKFLKGLSRVLAGKIESNESREKLFSEYTEEIKNFTELIKDTLSKLDPVITGMFMQKFFELTPECFMNLNLLIEDLSVCKDFFNDKKFDN